MKPITIRDIVQVLSWKDVVRARNYYYPTDKGNDYAPVLEYLKTVPVLKPRNKDEYIEMCIGGFRDKILDKDEDERQQFYVIHTNLYSLSFRKWAELANIPISEQTLSTYKIEEILAQFLWEITFYGTEKDSQELGKRLQKQVKKIKRDLKKKK